jgi:hypothetical protein
VSEASVLPFRERRRKPSRSGRRATAGPACSASVRPLEISVQPLEIVAPDPYCTALLLEYAAPLFPAELVAGSAGTVRLQPPAGGTWVLELLALVERWLESIPLPCATVRYGGRSYLIRASTDDQLRAAVQSARAPSSEVRT